MATIRAAIYARVSTKPQAGEDKISIPDQLRECRAYITKEGWVSAGEFVDAGVSANLIDRPGLQQLFRSLRSFDVVVAWDFDRFYRDKRSVAGYILDTLDEAKKQITSLKQPIPVYNPAQYDPRENDTPYMLREMAGFTSGIDNRRRYRTLRKGLQERFRQGQGTHTPPYGYRVVHEIRDSKVVKLPRQIVPEQAAVIRRIYDSYISGMSCGAIADALNADGIRSAKGCRWRSPVVRYVLRNPTYCGKVYRKILDRCPRPEGDWIVLPGAHEPIIDERVWREAQTVRERRRPVTRSTASPLLLSGLLKCGHCDFGMYISGTWNRGYYMCGQYRETGLCRRNSYARNRLEQDVLGYLFGLVRSEDLFDTALRRQQVDGAADTRAELQRLEQLRGRLPERRRRLIELYEKAEIGLQEFVERRDEVQAEGEALDKRIGEKQAELGRSPLQNLTREQFTQALGQLEGAWDSCGIAQQKAMLRSLVDRIVIKDKAFQVQLRLGHTVH